MKTSHVTVGGGHKSGLQVFGVIGAESETGSFLYNLKQADLTDQLIALDDSEFGKY